MLKHKQMKSTMKYFLSVTIALSIVTSSIRAHPLPLHGAEPLDAKQQSIVTIAAFTANGNEAGLNMALTEGLNAGLTVNEIKEVIVQLYAYAGFPRSLNALSTFMKVLEERKEKGINDVEGKSSSPLPANKSKLVFGTEIQTRLVGRPVKGEIYEFAPAADQFLKEHLFCDIFGRDVLDFKTREIATISALASLGAVENQLRSHFNVGMHNGLTKEQLTSIVSIIQNKVGHQEGNSAYEVLQTLLNPDKSANALTHKNGSATAIGKSPNAFPKGEKVNSNNFTGTAWHHPVVTTDSVFNTSMGSVTFELGARTNWHRHPSGQILVITDGAAYYQEKGKPKQTLSKGQVVKCPPGVTHWHGATRVGSMTHLAVSPNLEMGQVVWLEKVTDEEYESTK
jgi:4-carboxymuconolactone decarboxylase